ncbi:MAG: copper chaperone PCu(A)C [Erythrobacter sp.]|uniref:copper chaperone PCu(A)C n=1 Tax=Erythrobacter sp. TaxID=1042 RepID=UPI0025D7F6F7|nr:copper chaperone PCu(A)C [Erythrobacter sp.]MCL9999886.1 copper chaperone PCu(A)C [Erythrobacter sp.]
MNSILRAASAVLALAAIATLSACAPDADAPPSDTATAGAVSAGLTVSNARVFLPPVAGNPAAVYFDLSYSGAPGVSLESVTVEGAGMTMIHDYAESAGKMEMVMADEVPLSAGAPVSFAPGGLHVMAMEPGAALAAGSTAKVTLTLSDGTSVTVAAPVRAAGDER